jgi:hypothetical protein
MPKRTSRRDAVQTRLWRERITPAVLRRDMGVCHACRSCGCPATGADSADHDPVPRSECEARGISVLDLSNLKACHFKPCPHCGVRCQTTKFNGSLDAFRIKWEKITGRKAQRPGADEGFAPEGREF